MTRGRGANLASAGRRVIARPDCSCRCLLGARDRAAGRTLVADQRSVFGEPTAPSTPLGGRSSSSGVAAPSGEEEPPDDDGQNDDDVGETTGLTAGLPALGRPHPDVAHVPANCLERGGACASESTKTI